MQWAKVIKDKKPYTICNVHGFHTSQGKDDTPERIEQSRRIKEFLDRTPNPKILCGDFNLDINTKSLQMLEGEMTNLVKKHNITSTRTRFYEKPVKFADYMLVSPDIQVLDFQVLSDEVSDHSPLYLEFAS